VQTRASLGVDLADLGLVAGDTVLCHASLRSLGYVCGGAVAVVHALRDVIGPQGTLIVPAQTPDNRDPASWTGSLLAGDLGEADTLELIRQNLPAFQPEVSPSRGMGAIAELVRTWPGALRSEHPQTSFAGIGPRAKVILDGHALESPLGEDSPLARLEEEDAKVLLLGVGMNRVTAFHLAEYRVSNPPMRSNSCAVMVDSRAQWISYEGIHLDDSDFDQLGDAFETETQAVTTGLVGDAVCHLFDLRAAVNFAVRWLPAHRTPELSGVLEP